jgi:hypothetical protein
MDGGDNDPRGFLLSTVALHFHPQLAYISQPKWFVATEILHVIVTTSVTVNRMLKTTGRDCRDVHSSVLEGNVEGDVLWGFFLWPQCTLTFKKETKVIHLYALTQQSANNSVFYVQNLYNT